MFIAYFALGLLVLHMLLGQTNMFIPYTNLLGGIALAIEATLPIPQLLANWRRRGCKGFRVSVCINWIIGDTFKMWFFFASGSGEGGVPLAFKICGVFQACCDLGLGVQFWLWGDGPAAGHARPVSRGLELGPTGGVDAFGREKAVLSPVVEQSESSEYPSVGLHTGGDEKVGTVEERRV
jgi:hypothetical protein